MGVAEKPPILGGAGRGGGASKGSSAFALQRHLGLGLDGDNYPAQPPSGSSSCDPLHLMEHQR